MGEKELFDRVRLVITNEKESWFKLIKAFGVIEWKKDKYIWKADIVETIWELKIECKWTHINYFWMGFKKIECICIAWVCIKITSN